MWRLPLYGITQPQCYDDARNEDVRAIMPRTEDAPSYQSQEVTFMGWEMFHPEALIARQGVLNLKATSL